MYKVKFMGGDKGGIWSLPRPQLPWNKNILDNIPPEKKMGKKGKLKEKECIL